MMPYSGSLDKSDLVACRENVGFAERDFFPGC